MTDDTADLPMVLELERELQTPTARSDEARLLELLAPDFREIGASGREWDLTTTLDALTSEATEDGGAPQVATLIEVHDLRGEVIAPGVVRVLWDSCWDGRRARRSSIWCERATGWQLVHHQGTPLP